MNAAIGFGVIGLAIIGAWQVTRTAHLWILRTISRICNGLTKRRRQREELWRLAEAVRVQAFTIEELRKELAKMRGDQSFASQILAGCEPKREKRAS